MESENQDYSKLEGVHSTSVDPLSAAYGMVEPADADSLTGTLDRRHIMLDEPSDVFYSKPVKKKPDPRMYEDDVIEPSPQNNLYSVSESEATMVEYEVQRGLIYENTDAIPKPKSIDLTYENIDTTQSQSTTQTPSPGLSKEPDSFDV